MSVQRPPLEPLRSAYRIQYLSDEQLDQLQEATLDILENIGAIVLEPTIGIALIIS